MQKIYYFLLITLPITFKISITEGIFVFPQEILMICLFPISIVYLKVKKTSEPFIYLGIGLVFMLISSILSLVYFVDISGTLLVLKYLLYIYSIIIISPYSFNNFVNDFNKIALLSIFISLIILLDNYINFDGDIKSFLNIMLYDVNYIPSGLSNLNYSFSTNSFFRSTGNHGIYGSYLVLVYLVNFYQFKKFRKKINLFILILCLGFIFLLNSRETLMVLIISHFGLLHTLSKVKFSIKKLLIIGFSSFLVLFVIIYFNDNSIGVFGKFKNSFDAITSGKGDGSINARFRTWILSIHYFVKDPLQLIFGTGYNVLNYENALEIANSDYKFKNYATIPENFFFMFLFYGGVFSFLFSIFYWAKIFISFINLSIRKNKSLLPWLIVGLFLANNTGGSMISDLFLAQFALFYYYFKSLKNATKQNTLYNS